MGGHGRVGRAELGQVTGVGRHEAARGEVGYNSHLSTCATGYNDLLSTGGSDFDAVGRYDADFLLVCYNSDTNIMTGA